MHTHIHILAFSCTIWYRNHGNCSFLPLQHAHTHNNMRVERERKRERWLIVSLLTIHSLCIKRDVTFYLSIRNQYPSTQQWALNLTIRDGEKQRETKWTSKLKKEIARERERERAQLHVNYNLHVALNCEQWHSWKRKGEMKEWMREHKRQCAARLLNINSFIYMQMTRQLQREMVGSDASSVL